MKKEKKDKEKCETKKIRQRLEQVLVETQKNLQRLEELEVAQNSPREEPEEEPLSGIWEKC